MLGLFFCFTFKKFDSIFGLKLCHVKLDPDTFRSTSFVVWCGLDSIVCFGSAESSQCLIISTSGAIEETFLPGFISAVQVRMKVKSQSSKTKN
jgi:hypothetical protein